MALSKIHTIILDTQTYKKKCIVRKNSFNEYNNAAEYISIINLCFTRSNPALSENCIVYKHALYRMVALVSKMCL